MNTNNNLYGSVVETRERWFQVESSLYIGRKRNRLSIVQAQQRQPIRARQEVEDRTHETDQSRLPQYVIYIQYSYSVPKHFNWFKETRISGV